MADSSVVVTFEGGLDMVTPVQNSAPGTLVDCLNYEVGPIKGYRRIDGYERYDGYNVDGGIDSVYKLVGHPTSSDPAYTPAPGSIITKDGFGVAIVVKVGPDNVMYIVLLRTEANITTSNHPFRIIPPDGIGSSNFVVDEDMVDARDAGLSFQEFSEAIRDGQAFLRERVNQAPGRIAGVYRGRHRTYVAVDAVHVASPMRWLEDGMYVRLHGHAYRVMWTEFEFAWLARLNLGQSADNGLELVTYQQLINGSGNYETITEYTVLDEVSEARFAQMFYLESGVYVPIHSAPIVFFKDATQEFKGKVRLSDGTNYSTHEVIGYSVTEGSFSNGDAVGVLYLADGPGSSNYTGEIYPLDVITSEDGLTELATLEFIGMPTLPGTSLLRSRTELGHRRYFYQWGTYNFKATAGHEYVFSTNGVTYAAWIRDSESRFDCTWGYIYTGRAWSEPGPMFLSYHADQRLLLAYADGSIELSAVGDPFNFSGLDGAIELGNGDSITGVLEASGDTTLVFGPRTIRRLVGMGTDIVFNTISSSSGAFPYTACVVAGVPTYVNHNGICVLDQTSAYGDFKSSSVSGAIDPYLTPRVIFEFNRAEATGTLCAYPVRAKNQYRLLMQNGDVVSMSLTQQGPQFTKSSYTTAAGGRRIPIAYSSSVGNDGNEYILSVWDEALIYSITDAPNMQMIYRMDHGWGFDGKTFDHYIDTSYMFNENPNFLTIDKCALYGMGYGESSLRLMAFNVEDDFEQPAEVTRQDISMPRNPRVYSTSFKRVLGEVDHANWGRAIKLRFANIKDAGEDEVEPPHILQSVRLFVQTDGITE